jgi:membrane-associated phospholipid phosphatase
MFELHPIIWLQSWATPALTGVANGISLLGYTRAYVAIAVLLAFGFGKRAAVALLVLIALNAAFTDMAKRAASTPRPDANSQVRALSLYAAEFRQQEADTPTELEDSSGFPSGHVSATTAFAVGLALLLQWRRRGWILAALWIATMALARMYLGRHFLGDVIGGVLIGLAAVSVGLGVLKLDHLARELRTHHPWPAHRVMTVAVVLAGGALLLGLPDAGDAGRLLGTAVGVLFLVNHDVFARATARRARVTLVLVAAMAFGAAWFLMSKVLETASPSSASALSLAASALPNAALLIVPACVPYWVLRGNVRRALS